MKALLPLSFALVAIATACGAPTSQSSAHEMHAEAALTVHDAWAAPTPAGVDVAAGYLTISNHTRAADRLLSATSPRAERVEIHEMTMNGAVMQMRAVERLEIAAGQDVQLGPGGMHLMFFGVTEPFAQGQTIPVHLVFETAGAVDVDLPVNRRGAPSHGHSG
ncbi:MAG: copper chaperone PCu(A)C [Terricaulis sp.]